MEILNENVTARVLLAVVDAVSLRNFSNLLTGLWACALAFSLFVCGCRQAKSCQPDVTTQWGTCREENESDVHLLKDPWQYGFLFYCESRNYPSRKIYSDGTMTEQEFSCGVAEAGGKKVDIPLASTYVRKGIVHTRDIGDLKIQYANADANRIELTATDDQIKHLRGLAQSGR